MIHRSFILIKSDNLSLSRPSSCLFRKMISHTIIGHLHHCIFRHTTHHIMEISMLDITVSHSIDTHVSENATHSICCSNGGWVVVTLFHVFWFENVGFYDCWHIIDHIDFTFEFVRQTLSDVRAENLGSTVSEISRSWHVLSHGTDENHS